MNKYQKLKDELYDKIYPIIDEYDFGGVAIYSHDEYYSEVRDIVSLLPQCESQDDVEELIYNIFVEYFSKSLIILDKSLYTLAAKRIWGIIK